MTNLLTSVFAVWLAGLFLLIVRGFNLGRLTLNNIAPGETYRNSPGWLWRRRGDIGPTSDPACLTEVGREYRKKAIQNDRIRLFWMLGGLIFSGLYLYLHVQFR